MNRSTTAVWIDWKKLLAALAGFAFFFPFCALFGDFFFFEEEDSGFSWMVTDFFDDLVLAFVDVFSGRSWSKRDDFLLLVEEFSDESGPGKHCLALDSDL